MSEKVIYGLPDKIPASHAEIAEVHRHECPYLAADVILEFEDGRILFINRKYAPLGLALPGGHVDYGKESVEDCARREAQEETGLDVQLVTLLGAYSKPDRDPRKHICSLVYVAQVPEGVTAEDAVAGDDAESVSLIHINDLADHEFAFDHAKVLKDYVTWRLTGQKPSPR